MTSPNQGLPSLASWGVKRRDPGNEVEVPVVIQMNGTIIVSNRLSYICLLYRQVCFTGKYTTRKIHTKLHPGPEWRIFHILTSEDIDDVIFRSFTAVRCTQSVKNGER